MPRVSALIFCLSAAVSMHSTAIAQNEPSLKSAIPAMPVALKVSTRSDSPQMPVASKIGRDASPECSVTALQYRVGGVDYSVTSAACHEPAKHIGYAAPARNP